MTKKNIWIYTTFYRRQEYPLWWNTYGNQGVEKICFGMSGWSGTPAICKVIEEGTTMLFYYYEINNLSILSLKQSDLPATEL